MKNLKSYFLLDPDVHFLNHGSFGATPWPVFEVYQEWQRRLEWQPVQFLIAEVTGYLAEARAALAEFIQAKADDVVYVPNTTFAVNVVARSLPLAPGDEVLTTDHEYGACDNTWGFLSQKRGFNYVKQGIPLPATSAVDIMDRFWEGVTERTRLIFISHISSSTAVTFPAAAICQRARETGIMTIIDGAHALGHIPLDMAAIGADFYSSNAHKWLCSPKGSAFLYARPEVQHLLEPLVVSWGWGEGRPFTFGSDFLDYNQWLGTNDVSAYLTVPAAIQFQAEHNWTAVRQQCHERLSQTLNHICDVTNLDSIYSSDAFYQQMGAAPLPPVDEAQLKQRLLAEFQVEVPIFEWHGRQFIRVSVQGYNTQADLEALLNGLETLLPDVQRNLPQTGE